MKKVILVAAVAAMLAGCNKAGELDKQTTVVNGITFRGVATETRLDATDHETDGLVFTWEAEDDKIGMFALDEVGTRGTNTAYKALSSAASTDFEAVTRSETIEWGTGLHDFYAYYPYSESAGSDATAVPVAVPSAQTQGSEALAHITANNLVYAATEDVEESDGAVALAFRHAFSVLNLRLSTTSGEAKVSALKLTFDDAAEVVAFATGSINIKTGALSVGETTSNTITLTLSPVLTVGTTPVDTYMLITAGHAGKTFDVVATINGEDVTVVTDKTIPVNGGWGIPIGVKAPMSVTVPGAAPEPEPEAIDLSASGTANTYIVDAVGDYKFNGSVKGNGLARTLSYNGAEKIAYTTEALAIAPQKALVLWYNAEQTTTTEWNTATPINVESVELKSDGYIYFSTPETFVNGHAVIIAIDQNLGYSEIEADAQKCITNANVLWSWDLWFCQGYDPSVAPVTVGDYTMMDRNLGALSNGADITTYGGDNHAKITAVVGNYYQWGRKDPFPPMPRFNGQYGITDGLHYPPTYTPIPALQYTTGAFTGQAFASAEKVDGVATALPLPSTTEDISVSIARGVENPNKLIDSNYGGSSGDGFYTYKDDAYRVLWGQPTATSSGSTMPDSEAAGNYLKTIYDPCPAGWKLWTNAVFNTIDATLAPATNCYGGVYNGNLFPIAPGRDRRGTLRAFEGGLNLPTYTNGTTYDFSIRTYTANSNLYYSNWGYGINWNFRWNVAQESLVRAENITYKPNYPAGASIVRCIADTE
jgi:hypothetical protein